MIRYVLFVVIAGVIVLSSSQIFLNGAHTYFEYAMLRASPSSEKAFGYGTRHFDSRNVAAYDLDAASYFYQRTIILNPQHSLAYHEIARIFFLKGELKKALEFADIQVRYHGEEHANAYYVRGLIHGFLKNYAEAARDYEMYLQHDPHNWAAINDYAWVLLRDKKPHEAAAALVEGLKYFPDNPWLLNSSAIALYEMGEIEIAREQIRLAAEATSHLTEEDWLTAYPGNDPLIAQEGLQAFKESVIHNMHMIVVAAHARGYN